MLKKGKKNVCKRCEYNKECLHVNDPIDCCIWVDRKKNRKNRKNIKKDLTK